MKTKFTLFTLFTFILLFNACSKDDETKSTVADVTGKITGKVMAKNGLKPIGGALVFVENNQSKVYYTRTDAQGNFSLDAPVGNRNLQIQTGGGANFRSTIPVIIVKGQNVAIDPATTRLDQVARMAYIAGDFDQIQSIVTDLGYTIDAITTADLLDYSIVSQYDIIFLNCGGSHDNTAADQAATDTNLANFVTNGGSLYASDWAVAYLTGGGPNSSICGEANGFIPDDKLCSKTTGLETTIAGAQIVDANLAASLDFSTLNIQYDLGGWEQIYNFDPMFWDVMVSDPATNSALMIKTNHFSGGSIISPAGRNAADEDWMTICHHEATGELFTITIPIAEWPVHEAHGDSVGECSNSNNSGTIYYTTFHNHAGDNIVNTTPILQYVILNM